MCQLRPRDGEESAKTGTVWRWCHGPRVVPGWLVVLGVAQVPWGECAQWEEVSLEKGPGQLKKLFQAQGDSWALP